MPDFKVALWVVDFSFPVADMTHWLDLVADKARAAKAQNADILVMPEYACVHWWSFAPDAAKGDLFTMWTERKRDTVLEAVAHIAADTGIAILPGTFPVAVRPPYPAPMFTQANDGRRGTGLTRYFNRASVFGADGSLLHTQDKMVLTPWEMDEQGENMQDGHAVTSFMLGDVRVGVAICLDVQQSMVVHALYRQGIDVLIVPSMTMHPSGYNRVFINARARAIEGMMGVAAVGATGAPAGLEDTETNFSGAGLYGPCEMDMAADGIILQSGAGYGMAKTSAGPLFVGSLPIDAIRRKRVSGAEAWPGITMSPRM